MSSLQITEIFRSIQGESTHAGLPCTFIRLTGCNLRCAWCDTEYSFYGGTRMTLDEVMRKVADYGGKLVENFGFGRFCMRLILSDIQFLLGLYFRRLIVGLYCRRHSLGLCNRRLSLVAAIGRSQLSMILSDA